MRARFQTLLLFVLVAHAGLSAPAGVQDSDLSAALARLEAPEVAERREAERFLARSLRAEDLAELAQAVPGLGLEGRARLASALGSDPAHFELSALLVCEREPALFELGELALRRQLELWFGSPELPPSAPSEVSAALGEHFSDRLFQLTVGGRPLDEELGLLLRHTGVPEGLPGAGPLALALDPSLYVAGLEPQRAHGAKDSRTLLTGEPDGLLGALLEAHGEARLEGFAMEGPRAFLHVTHTSRIGSRDGGELFVDWCRTLVLDGSSTGARGARAEGAARALAATGFPAALDWLARRWDLREDRRALSGLLLAAERGWVAPTLARAGSVERLLAAADLGLAQGGALERRFAEEVARALGRLGTLPNGEPLEELLARGLLEQPDGSQAVARHRLRLGALAGLGRMTPETARLLRARLASPEPRVDPRLAVDMLRALARASTTGGSEPFLLADPAPFFGRDVAPAVYPLYDRWLAASGAHPPERWGEDGALGVEGGPAAILRARLVCWWLRTAPAGPEAPGQLAALVRALEAVGASAGAEAAAGAERNAADRLAEERDRVGRAPLAALFERARAELAEGPARERLERLEVLSGVASAERERSVLERVLVSGAVAPADLELAGHLAGSPEDPVGPLAREALRAALRSQLEAGARAEGDPEQGARWVGVIERALVRLAADPSPRGRVGRVEEDLVGGLQRDLGPAIRGSEGRGPAGPVGSKREWPRTLLTLLRTPDWPRLPRLAPLPLEALEVLLE